MTKVSRLMDWLRNLSRGRDTRPDVKPIPDDIKRVYVERDEELRREYVRAQTEALRALQDVRRGFDV
jgi:hypothetical protein